MDNRILTIDYSAGDAQSPVFLDELPGAYRGVQLEPLPAGTGYVQATLSSREDVQDGHAAWLTWPAGAVSSVTQDTIDPSVTAIRVYRSSGNLRLNVRVV